MPTTPRAWMYKKTIAPCKDCPERQVGCHSKCRKYADWSEQMKKNRIEITNTYRADREVEDYTVKEKLKNKRR